MQKEEKEFRNRLNYDKIERTGNVTSPFLQQLRKNEVQKNDESSSTNENYECEK